MSEVDDKNYDTVPQSSSEVPLDATEEDPKMPALESEFRALEGIANENFDILMPEIENPSPIKEQINNEEQENVANCLESAEEKFELTKAEMEHFSCFEDIENIESTLSQTDNSEQLTANKSTVNSESMNVALSEDCPKENILSTNKDLSLIEISGLTSTQDENCLPPDDIVKSPLKDLPQEEEVERTVSEVEENAEISTCENKADTTMISLEDGTINLKPNDDDIKSPESLTLTKSLEEPIVQDKTEVTENLPKSDSPNDTSKSVTIDQNIDLESRDISTPAFENDDDSSKPKAMECEDVPKSTTVETLDISKSVVAGTDDIPKSLTSESNDASKSSTMKNESLMTENNDTSKSVVEENKNIGKSTSVQSHVSTEENPKAITSTEENVEHMDTCDSQESINLVIDEETSNITEFKGDHSDNNKSDEDTNMEVDLNETPDEKMDKNEEEMKNEADKSTETTKDELNQETEKSDHKEIHNKSKDDDVIPIEQPPVPIIEIDDEEEIEENTNTKAFEANIDKDKDANMEESSISKEDNNDVDESNNDNAKTSVNFLTKDQGENTLLEKASEKPLDEEIIVPGTPKSVSDDMEETNDEVFYSKECINYECPHKHKQYFKVPQFAFSYFKVTKKKFKSQYICADCYDTALEMYEEFCGLISAKQPLLLENIPSGRQEFVEIIDSSDDEDSCNNTTNHVETTKTAFSKNDLALIKSELNDTIKSVLNRVDIQNQLTWSKTILTERLKRLEMETEYVDDELKALQRKADKMHEGLYSCPKIKIRQLQPLDLNSGKLMTFEPMMQKEVQPIPPVGEVERPAIQQNNVYYAVKNNPIASWVPCRVLEQVESSVVNSYNVKQYKIKFTKNQTLGPKTVPAKYLAYYDPPTVRLPIGTRVIAYFDATSLARGREKINVQSAFYPGIIAEPLKPNNKFRYLIFYDDGYTQYVYHKDVRLVCHVSECVWEDVHPASRDFIQKYLTQYSINRPMVQTQKGQSMNTESNGYWLHARVVDIDCSLVLMQFEGSKSHTEWIYRGSLRLGPVFKEYQKSLQKNSSIPVSRLPRRTEPFIRYTEDEETSSQQQPTEKSADGNRAVARKTFGRPDSMVNSAQSNSHAQQQQQPAVKHLNNSTIYVEDENKPKGKVVYYTAKRNLPPRKYKPHKCTPSCQFEITHNLSAYSPLSKPLLSGWERFIIRQKIKRVVTYRAPCGKILRNMKELHHYLRATKNALNVDNFDFSHEISCLAEYVIESAIIQKRDISGGQEKMAIPLVNYYDNTLPPECKYSAKVIPTEGVHINTDPAFLVGCDCEDDCADKTKCACWQLTLAGAKYGNPNAAPEEVAYQYRRLLDHVPTGIYECNANCKCKSSCLNRVVQNSLTMKLQVFKTSNRGWGLRCINDIPRGSFVCVYAGHLLTEAKANEGGQDAGDEYFAELDYIEVAEQIKEGYESDVDPPEPEEEDAYNPEMDDDDFTPSKSFLTRAKQRQNALKSTRSGNQEEDSQERQVINFNPNADMNEDSVRESSIRTLYGKDEACYVMDAKISGNLGRYFNHSCAPNMFVQNVFVDTHDLRFPNVAFFSSCNIRAGTELTWNYNYEVGVVPGKVLYCQCGAANCRLRLL